MPTVEEILSKHDLGEAKVLNFEAGGSVEAYAGCRIAVTSDGASLVVVPVAVHLVPYGYPVDVWGHYVKKDLLVTGTVDPDKLEKAIAKAFEELLDETEFRSVEPAAKEKMAKYLAKIFLRELMRGRAVYAISPLSAVARFSICGAVREGDKIYFSLNKEGVTELIRKLFPDLELPADYPEKFLYTLLRELHSDKLVDALREIYDLLEKKSAEVLEKMMSSREHVKKKIAVTA